ncbi:hypothetical protein [Dethiobacter alkaliphilus]|uniref:Uncharacterized protein n=1 Tax=Dethiobacter alkaliphilus AHT 1 TaxID=555088 RepID=C0GD32_DETAL|nr:hypothetical protein [Dethiobacter alkaliphilus]EEG79117.1 hypothetical protein DealDRAFT_0391 [Dethiobacter alkaliphilus AHT 1]
MQLLDAITNTANFYHHTRKTKEDYVNTVTHFFENYYGGKDNQNPTILDKSIQDIKKDQNNFALDIQEGLKSYPNDKYTLTCRLEQLIFYLNLKNNFTLTDTLLENFKHKDKNERLLKILKYLHTGEKSRQDIAENFGISDRALASDLKTLQDGFDFMGSNMQIRKLERGKNTYTSMIHPIFLALNTEEIYSMTVGLKLLSYGTVFEESMNRVADKIYKQLSDHATQIADSHTDGEKVTFNDGTLDFIGTYSLMQQSRTPFAYYLKEPIPCKVTYLQNGKEAEVIGTLHLDEGGYDRVVVQADGVGIDVYMDDVVNICRAADHYPMKYKNK